MTGRVGHKWLTLVLFPVAPYGWDIHELGVMMARVKGYVIVCTKGCGTFGDWADMRYCPACGSLVNIRPGVTA